MDTRFPQRARPVPNLPPQVRPIRRDGSAPAVPGVESAQGLCNDLPGLARQMCFATRYGIEL